MPDFPHLNLKRKLRGAYQFSGMAISKKPDPITTANLINRTGHGAQLSASASALSQSYETFIQERRDQGLPDAFNSGVLPVFLRVDPKDFDIEALKGFGIEIVSEEEDGYIIGANADNFSSLAAKIQAFIDVKGKSKDQAAKLWEIVQGEQWRAEYILSPELRERYPAGITDQEILTIDISVACYLKMPDKPQRVMYESDEDYAISKAKYDERHKDDLVKPVYRRQNVPDTDEQYERKLTRWRTNIQTLDIQRDSMAMERQDFLTDFIVTKYNGELLSSFIDMEDSFGFRAKINGQGFKDLVRGYAYIFEIAESDTVHVDEPVSDLFADADLEIIAPADDSPVFCVIDSGMQEEHLLLSPAILKQYSKNYVPHETTTADNVPGGGHGTKVGGAILYGSEIPTAGSYQPPCFLINARVLDSDNFLPGKLFPAELMEQIADDYDGVRLFNMSIASRGPCRTTHISSWAAKLDSLIHNRKLLFVIATGNLQSFTNRPDRPGIKEHLEAGRSYPRYLLEASSRISNPAQSLLSLTVGSVCSADFENADRISFGKRGSISSFSRSGPGMWNCVKPDVVEYGGDFLREKAGVLVSPHNDVSVSVVTAGGHRTGYAVGTSFAAPKVAHIVAQIAKRFPNDSTLLYKALVVQSARLPEHVFHNLNINVLKAFGYGVPDLQRSIENTTHRITFVTEGTIAAHQANLYTVKIPHEVRRAGTDYDILIEVTLTYTAEPRRTRKRLKSYFGSWLTWESSKLGENFDTFSARVLKDMEDQDEEEENAAIDADSIKWSISTSPTYGQIKGFKRQDSATQKDWVILKSYLLTEELSFAVVGHKGWDKDTTTDLPFALVISFEAIAQDTELYTPIEAVNRVEIDNEVEEEIEEAIVIPINQREQ
jgi:hypothetical protein